MTNYMKVHSNPIEILQTYFGSFVLVPLNEFWIFNNLSLQFPIKLFLIKGKGVQPNFKKKNLSEVPVQSTYPIL